MNSPAYYTRKITTLDAAIRLQQARRAELVYLKEQAAKESVKKRVVAKKPSKKKVPTPPVKGAK